MSNSLTPEQLKRLKKILKKESVDYYFFNPKEGNFILSQSERIAELESGKSSRDPLKAVGDLLIDYRKSNPYKPHEHQIHQCMTMIRNWMKEEK